VVVLEREQELEPGQVQARVRVRELAVVAAQELERGQELGPGQELEPGQELVLGRELVPHSQPRLILIELVPA
jgi:hypothetical protein